MTYPLQWQALAARIRGLAQAGELHARFLAIQNTDSYSRYRRLNTYCRSVVADLRSFEIAFREVLPPAATSALTSFLNDLGKLIEGEMGRTMENQLLQHALVVLVALEAEISYLLTDAQEAIRSRSEVAFLHLQRLLVVDHDLRGRWRVAFDEHETQCEKLGGVHLLWHGIWAFKVDAVGARTDLVFSEPFHPQTQRALHGLVLTEWKKVNAASAGEKFEEARLQARLYKEGPLAGLELTSYRYIIAVSLKEVPVPEDIVADGVTYRHINIALESRTPAVRSRKSA